MSSRPSRFIAGLFVALVAAHSAQAEVAVLFPHREQTGGHFGFVDKSGRVVVSPRFLFARGFSEGRGAILLNKQYGFIDQHGEVVIAPQFDEAHDFKGGRAAVRNGRTWSLIDPLGNVLVSDIVGFRSSDRDGRSVVGRAADDGKWLYGIIDRSGAIIIPLEYESLDRFSEGLALAKRNGEYGFLSTVGQVVIPFEFDFAREFQDGAATVSKAGQWHSEFPLIDVEGKPIALSIDHVHAPHDGPVIVRQSKAAHGLKFLVNRRGQRVTRDFDMADVCAWEHMFEGVIPVKKAGHGCAYIDASGLNVFNREFEQAGNFKMGLAPVTVNAVEGFGPFEGRVDNSAVGVIDRSGKFVVPPVFDSVDIVDPRLAQVRFGERLGYVDNTGRPLTFSASELEGFIAERRRKMLPPPPVVGRTVYGEPADRLFYVVLPEGMCVLDPTQDFDTGLVEQLSAEVEALNASRSPNVGAVAVEKSAALRSMFFDCGQLTAFKASGDKASLKLVGAAVGKREIGRDPSVRTAAQFITKMMCDMMGGGLQRTPDSRTRDARLREIWQKVERGAYLDRPFLDTLPWGCTAVSFPRKFTPGSEISEPTSAKLIRTTTLIGFPDWTFTLTADHADVSTSDWLMDALDKQSKIASSIVELNLREPRQLRSR
jgi:hypothetical protein